VFFLFYYTFQAWEFVVQYYVKMHWLHSYCTCGWIEASECVYSTGHVTRFQPMRLHHFWWWDNSRNVWHAVQFRITCAYVGVRFCCNVHPYGIITYSYPILLLLLFFIKLTCFSGPWNLPLCKSITTPNLVTHQTVCAIRRGPKKFGPWDCAP